MTQHTEVSFFASAMQIAIMSLITTKRIQFLQTLLVEGISKIIIVLESQRKPTSIPAPQILSIDFITPR